MTAIRLTLDGYLDEMPARFRVVSSPTGQAVDETLWACRTFDPHIVHALMAEFRPRDLMRISGRLVVPGAATGAGPRLDIDTLQLLAPADAWHLAGPVVDRHGPYLCVLDPETGQVPVFHETGTWVGTAANPGAITDLIRTHETEPKD
ncbi:MULTISPECIES: hypothetical protein [unclassified Streptomyces]|uniref:hypothetical protein n=1 Tax=unclassified Streptomyces TaxID=2593676 RepID=UPI00344BBF46